MRGVGGGERSGQGRAGAVALAACGVSAGPGRARCEGPARARRADRLAVATFLESAKACEATTVAPRPALLGRLDERLDKRLAELANAPLDSALELVERPGVVAFAAVGSERAACVCVHPVADRIGQQHPPCLRGAPAHWHVDAADHLEWEPSHLQRALSSEHVDRGLELTLVEPLAVSQGIRALSRLVVDHHRLAGARVDVDAVDPAAQRDVAEAETAVFAERHLEQLGERLEAVGPTAFGVELERAHHHQLGLRGERREPADRRVGERVASRGELGVQRSQDRLAHRLPRRAHRFGLRADLPLAVRGGGLRELAVELAQRGVHNVAEHQTVALGLEWARSQHVVDEPRHPALGEARDRSYRSRPVTVQRVERAARQAHRQLRRTACATLGRRGPRDPRARAWRELANVEVAHRRIRREPAHFVQKRRGFERPAVIVARAHRQHQPLRRSRTGGVEEVALAVGHARRQLEPGTLRAVGEQRALALVEEHARPFGAREVARF
ncbi:hypothetical protein HRbin41_01303 [bacterium HR41]|nr:hypothetical protein HRbin41_01303 [bacterium HR41]